MILLGSRVYEPGKGKPTSEIRGRVMYSSLEFGLLVSGLGSERELSALASGGRSPAHIAKAMCACAAPF